MSLNKLGAWHALSMFGKSLRRMNETFPKRWRLYTFGRKSASSCHPQAELEYLHRQDWDFQLCE
jgi:hypothetical protein